MTGAASCPNCQGALPEGARFCPACGLPLAERLATEERRIVTVLFADLEGFTALAERRDPESVKVLLDACFARLIPVIEEHGGHVDKVIGDELMAVFGAPTAHEDDAERAVRAALALTPALREVDPGLQLRIGLNTGEVLAGSVGPALGYTVTGDVVNTAHRLVTEAEPGDVLVGERTYSATESVIAYRLRGDLVLKGKRDRVRAWVPVTHTGATPTPTAPASPLVGRTGEMDTVQRIVGRAFARSEPEVVTVTGEPGVGKTRLATSVAARLIGDSPGPLVLWATCPAYGAGAELGPLAELVRSGLGLTGPASRDEQHDLIARRAAEVAMTSGADPRVLRDRIAGLLGLAPRRTRPIDTESGPARIPLADQAFGAAHAVIGHLAANRPVLLVIDDVHWAGPALLRFIATAPSRLDGLPVAVLAIARDDLLERPSVVVDDGPRFSTLFLEPLAPGDAGRLAQALIAAQAVGDERPTLGPASVDRLVAAAGGNPLLLEQLVDYLVESGGLVQEPDRWRWTLPHPGVSSAGLPDGMRSLIGARLDALPADERQVLTYASIFGRRFWRDAVADLGGIADIDPLLDRLTHRGLVIAITDEGYGDHAFRHVLTRDVTYAALPISDRAILHARAASWLDLQPVAVEETAWTSQLAHHYERAVVLGRVSDHTDPGLSQAAFAALLRAARDDQRRDSLRQAAHWYRRARDLGNPDPRVMAGAVAEHGEVLLQLRRLDDAREAFEEVSRRAEATDTALGTSAVAHLGAVSRLTGDTELAKERFEMAIAAARAADDPQLLADVHRLQGWSEITAGRPRTALPQLRRAAEIEATLDVAPRRGETLQYLGWCEFLSGRLADARQHLWDAMAQSVDVEDTGAIGWCFGLLGFTLLHGGQAARSLEISSNLRQVARRNSDPAAEWTCATLEAASHLALGDVDEAEALVREAVVRTHELNDAWGLAMARVVHAQALRVRGDLDDARTVLHAAVAATRDVAYVGEDARIVAELARVELDRGALDEAERHGRHALALVRAGVGDHESGLRAIGVLAALREVDGDTPGAMGLLEEAVDDRAPDDRTDGWRQAALALAELCLAAGHVDRARTLHTASITPPTDDVLLAGALTDLGRRVDDATIGNGGPGGST